MTNPALALIAQYIALEMAEAETCPPVALRQDWLDSLSEAEAAIIDEFENLVQIVADDAIAQHQAAANSARVALRVVNGSLPTEPTP